MAVVPSGFRNLLVWIMYWSKSSVVKSSSVVMAGMALSVVRRRRGMVGFRALTVS